MKIKGVQHISSEYLKNTKGVKPEQVIRFLEDFRKLHYGQKTTPSKLISIRVPQDLLNTFKKKSEIAGIGYQAKIKELMREWVDS